MPGDRTQPVGVDVCQSVEHSLRTVEAWPTLKVVALSVHEDVVDQDDAEDAGPEVNVAEDEHKSHILGWVKKRGWNRAVIQAIAMWNSEGSKAGRLT